MAIARALLGAPELLLCDEPTGNLDSVTTRTILDLLAELNADGDTMVMITHEHDVAGRAGRQAHIVDGRLAGGPVIVDAPPGPVAPSGMSTRDLGNEAVAGLFARPARTVLTCLGTVVGLAALVATLGLSRTAGNQIVGRFDELAATEILVKTKVPSGTRSRRGHALGPGPGATPERGGGRGQPDHGQRRRPAGDHLARPGPPGPHRVQAHRAGGVARAVRRRARHGADGADVRRGPFPARRPSGGARPQRRRAVGIPPSTTCRPSASGTTSTS